MAKPTKKKKREKPVNGNAKGKAGEREAALLFRDFGFTAHRSQQYCGRAGDADVKTFVEWLHVEVKRVERLNIVDAFLQAATDAKGASGCPKTPVVFHRRNRSPWLATLAVEDFLTLLSLIVQPGAEPSGEGQEEAHTSAAHDQDKELIGAHVDHITS